MMEQLLRDTFARHEELAPPATQELRSAIALGARRRRIRRRFGAASGAFIAVLAVISVFALTTKPPRSADALFEAPEKPEKLTLLLLGTDRRQTQSPDEPVRSDAIILLHVDPAAGKAFQISIPRDLLVATSRGKDKINGEFYFGGYDATAQVVSTLAGLPIDGGAVVDFAGLQRVINQLGGVDLCVDQRTVSAHLGRTRSGEIVSLKPGAQPIVYEPGCRRFQGWEAIDYVRQRKDVDRDRHLRDLLAALAHSVPVTDPVSLSKLLSVLPESVDLHLGSRSLTTVAFQLAHIGADGLVGLRLPTRLTEQGTVVLTPDADGLFAAMRAGTLTEWLVAHPAYAS